MASTRNVSKKKFKTEVQQLLDLVIHALYTNKDIFLRELISNASDAIDLARFEAVSDKSLLEDDPDWKIRISTDTDARTITISDNGIGMSREEIESNIGTIANSGTRAILEEIKKGNAESVPDTIGQFGVGFYSAFMVADTVTVISRRAGKDAIASEWTSTSGQGTYRIRDGERDSRGTDVILHLREDTVEYTEGWKIKKIVEQYSDFVSYPIVMAAPDDDEEAEEQTLNSMKALWTKPKQDVEKDEYHSFYKQLTHDPADPLDIIHYHAEGTLEFYALLFLPAKLPFGGLMVDRDTSGVGLYVRHVFISNECKDLMPEYLRFVKGVVESNDLPLNVSRETLQDNPMIRKIQKNLVGKILDTLAGVMEKRHDDYLEFYNEHRRYLKEGVHSDFAQRDALRDLLLFESTIADADAPTSLKDYVGRMKDDQKNIYFIVGEDASALRQSPHLEIFKKKAIEVLLMTDPIDEWIVQDIAEVDGKPFKAADRATLELTDQDADESDDADPDPDGGFAPLLEFMKERLKDELKDVRLSPRLIDSACCLVTDDHDISPHMERLYKAMNQDTPDTLRILELNPDHPVLPMMRDLAAKDSDDPKLGEYADLLYEQSLLVSGAQPKDPQRFSRMVSDLMAEVIRHGK